ncbi:MAG: oxaloacetate decarboxylase subunit gamma [Kiritimatiellaceae bacterium]|nr:oxaloacetate decarboxylase subunit gamma [Kiritimatiellaceae bacterium]
MAEGLVLLVIGMVTVFGFLQLMVSIMNLSAKFFIKLEERRPAPQPAAAPAVQLDLAPIAIAIAAAKNRTR